MLRPLRFLAAILLSLPLSAATIPTPSEFLKINVGADRTLADYRQIRSYFDALDAASDRVSVETLGRTTLGEPMIMAVISSEKNIANLDRIRQMSHTLADPRGAADDEVESAIRDGKTIVLVTCNIHSTEIGSSQMAMEWAHDLAVANDAKTTKILNDVVLLLVPSLNPDGQIMVTDWYRKYLGTKYEGSEMPWLYHPYVGHDNNRDWYMLTQKETRNMSRAIYFEWFPQVFVDLHQMQSDGPRIFIPPFADPVDPDVNPLIWREVNVIGSDMALRLEQQKKPGAIYGFAFDAYWMGGTRNTGWWKNITGLLLETASARVATPVYIEPTELDGGEKGLMDYKAQTNFPNPWTGGWWRLRDVMDYERTTSDALIETASNRREDFLRDVVTRSRQAIAEGGNVAYRISVNQNDYAAAKRLAELMADNGVDVFAAADGGWWIPVQQPYGRFVHEILEPQRYPEVRPSMSKDILRPYDVATWTLPLMTGVIVEKTTMPGRSGMTKLVAPIVEGKRAASPLVAAQIKAALDIGTPFYAILPASSDRYSLINDALRRRKNVRVLNDGPYAGTIYVDADTARTLGDAAAIAGIPFVPEFTLPPNTAALHPRRVGLYKPWRASVDEGWTRWVLEQYGFAPVSIDNETMKGGALRDRFDVIILPDVTKDLIATGTRKRDEGQMRYTPEMPPEYKGGIGDEGRTGLQDFVTSGGTLITLGQASEYVANEFNVPFRNSLATVKSQEFYVPGSLLRVNVNPHPVTWGLPSDLAVFQDEAIAFETTLPGAEMQRWVLASYPADPRDVLLSGWITGQEKLTRRAAAVAMTYGKGKIVAFGFRPQHRAQTLGTFGFLFNAIYWE